MTLTPSLGLAESVVTAGRVSSIIDIRTNDGNMKETHGVFGLSIISDKFHIEGRRSY